MNLYEFIISIYLLFYLYLMMSYHVLSIWERVRWTGMQQRRKYTTTWVQAELSPEPVSLVLRHPRDLAISALPALPATGWNGHWGHNTSAKTRWDLCSPTPCTSPGTARRQCASMIHQCNICIVNGAESWSLEILGIKVSQSAPLQLAASSRALSEQAFKIVLMDTQEKQWLFTSFSQRELHS